MAKDIKTAFIQSTDTILADMIGVVSLIVILYAGLSIPSFV